jgi:hypothetical protein
MLLYTTLHDLIARSSSTFGNCPIDELLWGLDTAALAMDTILRIDNELTVALGIRLAVFIDACRTESLLRSRVLLDRNLCTELVSECD